MFRLFNKARKKAKQKPGEKLATKIMGLGVNERELKILQTVNLYGGVDKLELARDYITQINDSLKCNARVIRQLLREILINTCGLDKQTAKSLVCDDEKATVESRIIKSEAINEIPTNAPSAEEARKNGIIQTCKETFIANIRIVDGNTKLIEDHESAIKYITNTLVAYENERKNLPDHLQTSIKRL